VSWYPIVVCTVPTWTGRSSNMLCFGIGVGVRVKGYSLYLLLSGDDTSVIRSVVRVSLVVPSHQQVYSYHRPDSAHLTYRTLASSPTLPLLLIVLDRVDTPDTF
jgi:hypothetical protein